MPRLDKKIKEKLLKQIEGGVSISKVSKSLNLGKSTIYYHYKKVKGKRYKEPIFESKLSIKEGESLGVMIGDGSLGYYKNNHKYQIKVSFGIKDKEYARYVKKLFEEFFNKEFNLRQNRENLLDLSISSKKVYLYFKKFLSFEQGKKYCTIEINNLKSLPFNFKIGILKGLIDTDGTIVKEKSRVRLQFYTTSRPLINQFSSLLEEHGSKYGNYRTKSKTKKFKEKNIKVSLITPFIYGKKV